MPDYILSAPISFAAGSAQGQKPLAAHATSAFHLPSTVHENKPAVARKEPGLVPVSHLHRKTAKTTQTAAESNPDPVREALVKLYNDTKDCHACGLGALRRNFVFGSGNAHAGLLVIGEAPGADEDDQGLPFVGKAGELLTKMLAAITIDRKKHAFIANVLKCRPPENRNPEQSEIVACRHILLSQIDIIKPKVILLLGRIAAHSLLDSHASIAVLRTETHQVAGIPAFVTYHPASLLRNEEYKRPAWEDMQKLQRVLTTMGFYADSSI